MKQFLTYFSPYLILSLCVHTHMYVCMDMHIGSSKLVEVSCLTYTMWVLGLNSSYQTWQQRPIPTGPSYGPFMSFLRCGRGHASATVHMWRSELNLKDSALFLPVGPRDWIQVTGFDSRDLYPLSHHTGKWSNS